MDPDQFSRIPASTRATMAVCHRPALDQAKGDEALFDIEDGTRGNAKNIGEVIYPLVAPGRAAMAQVVGGDAFCSMAQVIDRCAGQDQELPCDGNIADGLVQTGLWPLVVICTHSSLCGTNGP